MSVPPIDPGTVMALMNMAAMLKSQNGKDSTQNMEKTVAGIVEANAGGTFDKFPGILDQIKEIIGQASSGPLGELTGIIKEGTADATIALQTEMFKLLEKPAVQDGIKLLIDFLNGVAAKMKFWVELAEAFADELDIIKKKIKDMTDLTITIKPIELDASKLFTIKPLEVQADDLYTIKKIEIGGGDLITVTAKMNVNASELLSISKWNISAATILGLIR